MLVPNLDSEEGRTDANGQPLADSSDDTVGEDDDDLVGLKLVFNSEGKSDAKLTKGKLKLAVPAGVHVVDASTRTRVSTDLLELDLSSPDQESPLYDLLQSSEAFLWLEADETFAQVGEVTFEHTPNVTSLKATDKVMLLRLEMRVTKEGDAAAPEDGLVVKKTDTVRYRLSPGLPDNPVLFEDKIQWHWRILKWDGTYSDWTAYINGQGHTFTAQPATAGIYEVKATMDGQVFFLKRKKDAPHSLKKKDENDCFGVVDEQWQINVRDHAKANLGSVAYAQGVANSNVPAGPPGGYKCNLFVGHKATDAGAIVPKINGRNPFSRYHPSANQWADTEDTIGEGVKPIPNWTLLPLETYPQAGFVVACGVAGGIAHTGILDYDGAWISAGATNVNRIADVQTYTLSRFRKYTP